jgi:RimJ/RimL family protein N-acetyltransferase
MGCMPRLVPPAVPAGSLRGRPQPVLTAPGGLTLRPWQDTDAAVLLQAHADPDIRRWHRRGLASQREALALIASWRQGWQDETRGCWAITDGQPGGVLGRLSLRVQLELGVGEVGYWVLPPARGRGVAPRALAGLTGWLLDELRLHRVELGHSVANAASCRVAEKSGYQFEGVLRGALQHDDGWHDMHLHAVIASDPRPPGA